MLFAFKNSRQLGVAGKRRISVGLHVGAKQGGVLNRAKDPPGGDRRCGGLGRRKWGAQACPVAEDGCASPPPLS